MKVEMGRITLSNTERYHILILKMYSEESEILYYYLERLYWELLKCKNPTATHERKEKNSPPNV